MLERLGTIFGAVLMGAALTACGGVGQLAPGSAVSSDHSSNRSGSTGDLLYVAGACGGICIFTYPEINYVASITGIVGGFLCTDADGDVYVTEGSGNFSVGYIYEFAHGGTEPIKTLNDTGFPEGCSVDPTTGNLAVANEASPGTEFYHGDLAIYANAEGTPTYYKTQNITNYAFCSYDNKGNLLVDGSGDGTAFAILPRGGNSLNPVTFSQKTTGGTILWDGQYFDIGQGYVGHGTIDRVSISGSSGTVVSQVTIGGKVKTLPGSLPFALNGKTVALFYRPPVHPTNYLGFWRFPQGGKPRRVVKQFDGYKMPDFMPYGIIVSRKP